MISVGSSLTYYAIKDELRQSFFWPLTEECCHVITWNTLFTSMYTCEHDEHDIKLGDLCLMVMCHTAPPFPACFCNLHNDVGMIQ